MTTSSPIDWPTGGFEWTDKLRAKLPIIRGIRVTDPKPPTGAWAKPPRLTDKPPSDYHARQIKNYLDSRAKRGLPPASKPWTKSEAQARLDADALRNSDWEYWQELALQFFYKEESGADFSWALEAALELHGPVFATRWLLHLRQEFNLSFLNGNDRLREALACSSEDDYRAALRVAADYRGDANGRDLSISYLFPDQADWAEQCAVWCIPSHWKDLFKEGCLDHFFLSVEVAKKDCYNSSVWKKISPSAALLHIHRHGEAALPILEVMVDRQSTASNKLALLNLIVQLRTPGTIPAVVARFDKKWSRAALDKLAERWPAACMVSALERAAVDRCDELDGWITHLALRQPQAVESALAACSPEARARGADLMKSQAAPEEAPAEALPEVLGNAHSHISMATSRPIDWPTGGFEWTEDLREKLPIIRGIRVTGPKPPTGAWAKPPRLTDEPSSDYDYYARQIKGYLDSRAKRGLPPAAKPWTESEAQARLNADALRNPDWEYWQELALQFFYKSGSGADFPWVLAAALELHGPALATRWLLHFQLEFNDYPRNCLDRLREALACSSEDDYRAALQVAADYRGKNNELDLLTSYLFPDQANWAEQSAVRGIPYRWEYWSNCLDHFFLSVEVAKKDCYDSRIWKNISPSAALLHIYRHGEAALPILEVMLDRQSTTNSKLALLNLIVQLRTPGTIPAVVARFDKKWSRATLDKLAERWPAACLVSALEHAAVDRCDELDGWITRLALRQPDAVAPALAACSPEARARGADLVKPQAALEEAPAEALPEVLRNPRWTSKDRPKPLPALELEAPPQPKTVVWPKGVRERWLRLDSEDFQDAKRRLHEQQEHEPDLTMDQWGLRCMGVKESAHHRAYAGKPLRPEDFEAYKNPEFLMWMRPKTAQAVWAGIPAKVWHNWSLDVLRALFAQGGMAALPRMLKCADSWEFDKAHISGDELSILLPARADWLASHAAWALRNKLKQRTRADGIAWLRAHPETAITALIPTALGEPCTFRPLYTYREYARTALRWLAEDGKEEELRRIAADYGADAAAAVDALLKTDPLWIVPAKPPKLPAFFVPVAFHRPRLNGGGALPLSAVEHLGTMLAISCYLDEPPYAGLAQVKAACTSDSLSEFAWDVFEAWLAAGAPSKEDWAFTALALLGDDETARRLTPLLAQWSRHGAHVRATVGLDVLVTIGTDVAMQRLSTLVDNKAASELLRNKARQRLTDIAQGRGLSEEELADWLVPDLELNANGTLTLDFGPRQFMVGFDEALRPWARDAEGVQLKTLPKPIQSDDPDAARAATQRFNALKKDAKAIAKQHIERLAKAMTSRRRWTPASFRMLFMEHPVMCHLARRLVWGVYHDGALVEAFRVAEDSSLADRHDAAYALPDAGAIGLVMVAELSEELYREFGQIFADYEIIQPFKQLGRELYRPDKTEQKSGEVTRFVGKKVHGGSLNALANRGWRQDRGPAFCKPLDGGLTVVLEAQALGSYSGSGWGESDHAFGKLFVRRDGSDARVAVTELTPLAFSEAMRDVDLLPVLKPR